MMSWIIASPDGPGEDATMILCIAHPNLVRYELPLTDEHYEQKLMEALGAHILCSVSREYRDMIVPRVTRVLGRRRLKVVS